VSFIFDLNCSKSKKVSGFTLLELVVVCAFIAVLTGMILPIYNRAMYSLRVRNSIQDITSTIRYAQEKAIAESREMRLLIDPKTNQISVVRIVEREGDKRKYEPISTNEGGAVMTLPETIKITRINAGKDKTTGMYYISCYPNGASDPAQIEIQTMDRRQNRIVIKSLGALGRFEVK